MDLKSIGVIPRRFEPCQCRKSIWFLQNYIIFALIDFWAALLMAHTYLPHINDLLLLMEELRCFLPIHVLFQAQAYPTGSGSDYLILGVLLLQSHLQELPKSLYKHFHIFSQLFFLLNNTSSSIVWSSVIVLWFSKWIFFAIQCYRTPFTFVDFCQHYYFQHTFYIFSSEA